MTVIISMQFLYFRQECDNEGGTESGSCADGIINIKESLNE